MLEYYRNTLDAVGYRRATYKATAPPVTYIQSPIGLKYHSELSLMVFTLIPPAGRQKSHFCSVCVALRLESFTAVASRIARLT